MSMKLAPRFGGPLQGRRGAAVALLAILLPPAAAAKDAPRDRGLDRISVAAEATVDGDIVRLGDVARLEGPSAVALAAVELGPAPAPGAARSFAGASILAVVRERVMDIDRVRYRIPALVRVRRRAQEVSAAALRAIVEDYMQRRAGSTGGDVVLRQVDVAAPVALAPGPFATQVTPVQTNPAAGTTRLLVEFLQDQRVTGSATVTAHVAVFETAWIARRAIPAGVVIGPEDVVAERRDASALPRGAITRAGDAVGKEARVAIPTLAPLRHDQLRAPAVVRRGDVVTLLAESAGLRVTTRGEVREDAPQGAQVRVWNVASGKEVVGRVMDARTVAVAF
jgi:flagella basal body P-ring formation protein FlgA